MCVLTVLGQVHLLRIASSYPESRNYMYMYLHVASDHSTVDSNCCKTHEKKQAATDRKSSLCGNGLLVDCVITVDASWIYMVS